MKNYYKNILLSVSVAGLLVACGNGGPSKRDAEDIYNSNAKRTYIKVTDLRCDPAEHGSFSCFIAYQRYVSKEGVKSSIDDNVKDAVFYIERLEGEERSDQEEFREKKERAARQIALLEEFQEKMRNAKPLSQQEIKMINDGYLEDCDPPSSCSSSEGYKLSFNPKACLKFLQHCAKPQQDKLNFYDGQFKESAKKVADLEAKEEEAKKEAIKKTKTEVKVGNLVGGLKQNKYASFTKVDGRWETDAFNEID